ncbi:MAG TPA: maltose alpha-D-glucosyltransferase [Anaerolineaceae bacterium]|nr:maltose alpha-D-glucosyltransferase [Anaerolineaceae bacterium]
MANTPWYQNAVFYEVYIRAFADGNGDGHGDFIGLTQKLDYFLDLGVDCIWISPFYPSPLYDDGYDISDYYNIHPDYGTLEDFKTFLHEAHVRGLKVIADLVLNHTSDKHPWFYEARSNPESPYRDYYVWSDTDQKYAGARIIFLDTEPSNWTWDPVAGKYFWHRFYSSQPDLNYDNPRVQEEMLNVMRFWLDMGLDGFRADAVPYLFEREGTNCENLPETHKYLKKVRRFMDINYPGTILLGEANQWPSDLRPYFGNGDEFQMAFHFPVMPRIFMALRKEDASPIVQILNETPEIPSTCQWCTFLRNHDELTLEMVTEEERQWMWQQYAPEPRMRLNLGIRRRLAPLLDNDLMKIELVNALLFSLPGSPILYYGDEIGMGDNIWLDDRDGVRTPMQWDGEENAGFSKAPSGSLYLPNINDPAYGFRVVNVEHQRKAPESLWNRLQRMLALRKAHPVFGIGSTEFPTTGNQAVLAVLRDSPKETVLAILNLSGTAQSAWLPLGRWTGVLPFDLVADRRVETIMNQDYHLEMKAYEFCWLKLL